MKIQIGSYIVKLELVKPEAEVKRQWNPNCAMGSVWCDGPETCRPCAAKEAASALKLETTGVIKLNREETLITEKKAA